MKTYMLTVIVALGVILPVLLFFSFRSSGSQQVDNATIKSAYVYHLATYVKWENLPLQNEFLIGVIGNAPDAKINIPTTKKVMDRTVRVVKATSIEQAERLGCRLVYLASDQSERLSDIGYFLVNRRILTISASSGFIQNGVMINLFQEEGKVYFEINQKAVKSGNVKLSSQVYSLAKRIVK